VAEPAGDDFVESLVSLRLRARKFHDVLTWLETNLPAAAKAFVAGEPCPEKYTAERFRLRPAFGPAGQPPGDPGGLLSFTVPRHAEMEPGRLLWLLDAIGIRVLDGAEGGACFCNVHFERGDWPNLEWSPDGKPRNPSTKPSSGRCASQMKSVPPSARWKAKPRPSPTSSPPAKGRRVRRRRRGKAEKEPTSKDTPIEGANRFRNAETAFPSRSARRRRSVPDPRPMAAW